MTPRSYRSRRATPSNCVSARALLPILVIASLLAGCDSAGAAANGSTGNLASQLSTFVVDFARQALAAWLL